MQRARWVNAATMAAAVAGAALVGWCLATTASAQTPPAKTRPRAAPSGDVKRLDTQMEKVRDTFLRETHQLIDSYEEMGQYDRARFLLEALHKLDPADDTIRTRLDELAERILDSSTFDIDVDPAKSWQPVGRLSKDQAFRITATGESKFTLTASAGPAGLPESNPAEDLVAGVPLGGLMGVVAPPGGARGAGEKAPKPFLVGAKTDRVAERDGVLYLKLNVPPGSKVTGKFSVTVSGAAPLE